MIFTLQFPKNRVATTFFPLILLADCFYDFINSHLSVPGVRFVPDLFLITLFFFSLKEGYGFRHKKEFTFLRRTNFSLLLACLFHLILLYIKGGYFQSIHPTTLMNPIWEIWPYLQIPIYGYISFRILEERGYLRLLKTIIFVSIYLTLTLYISTLMPRHNAFIGGLDIIIVLYIIHIILNKRYNIIQLFFLLTFMIIAFFLPFYSYLRGATITSVILLMLFIASYRNRYNKVTMILFLLATIAGLLFITAWKPITERYSEHSRFGYDNPFMLYQSISSNAPNIEGRIIFWANILEVLKTSPILGSQFTFSFEFGSSQRIEGSHMLHNFFATAFADGGLVLAIPLLYLVYYALITSIRGVYMKKPTIVFYSCIALVIVSTYATNVYGHSPQHSRIGGIILMSSLVLINYHLSERCSYENK